jgi:hypothetical protein
VSKGVHGVFPVDGILQLCGDGGAGGGGGVPPCR